MPADLLDGWPPAVLDPAGPYAGSITVLAWVLFGIAVVVLGVVLASLWIALFGSDRLRAKLGGRTIVWIGGIAFPIVVLTALLVYGLTLTKNLREPAPADAMHVRITGEMWWWRVAYLDDAGRPIVRDANELHIPVGQPVELELTSADVIHSFWVPRLSGKLDMIPGRLNTMRIQANEPGVYGGQCAEYCGGPHALMGFVVVAQPPQEFARFLAARRTPSPPPTDPQAARGTRLFQTVGCAACHRIAGTPANGFAGPDLTHIGSRRTIGAGILPNNLGTLIGWIGNSQEIKPGNRMPNYSELGGKDLEAIARYLETRK